MKKPPPEADPGSLDPQDWTELRAQSHRMLDDMLDYLEQIRGRPVWQPVPGEVRASFHEALPREPADLAAVHEIFKHRILPYAVGNAHPRFMGWVHGGGTAVGMLAEMLAAGLNANVGGRDQIPLEVEQQVLRWMRELFGFPEGASGLFVTGTSMANMIGLLVARTAALGIEVRHLGIAASNKRLTGYASAGAHGCIAQAMDLAGFGSDALRLIAVNDRHEIDIETLRRAISKDRAAGLTPFFIAGTAGTVDVGAIDDLAALAGVAKAEGLWFHVDGAFGALAMLAPDIAPRLAGIERADSIGFDFHKWGQVPYDAGFILVRDGALHQDTFVSAANYLKREPRGMAAGSPWPCDFGPDLSRGFRALKTWFTIKTYGAEQLGKIVSRTCFVAQYLEQRIKSTPVLELLAPVSLNIVCFRYRCEDIDRVNANLTIALQESGIAAPSETLVNGRQAIRVAIFNHRTTTADIDALINAAIVLGAIAANGKPVPAAATGNLMSDGLPGYIGFAGIWRLMLSGIEIGLMGPLLEARLARNPENARAMMDIATLAILTRIPENREYAFAMQSRALNIEQLYRLPAMREEPAIRLLSIVSPGDMTAITHLDCLLEGSDVELTMLYARPDLPLPSRLPDHDLVFVAIGECGPNRPLLKQVEEFAKASSRPVLNAPDRILRLSRDSVSALLRPIPGIAMPMTVGVGREHLEKVVRGELPIARILEDGTFPIIARPLDSQGGKALAKLDDTAALASYLQTTRDSGFFISRFVDYRGPDGLFRKYRVVLIEGRPFACHMGISTNWMIHYVNADMDESAEKRAEEARFMADFDTDFAVRHKESLTQIDRLLGLDYFAIDCGETPDGKLLVFEADTAMLVHAMDPPDLYPYKQPQMHKLFDAFREMLANAAKGSGPAARSR